MSFSYLGNKKWKDISRDERMFCSHLYFELVKNPLPFFNLLQNIKILTNEELDKDIWESAFEVCFYRDVVFNLGYNGVRKIGATKFKNVAKRTFDLCLFSENHIIILEAKSQGGFNTTQTTSFTNDVLLIRELIPDTTNVTLLGITASNYKPKETTK